MPGEITQPTLEDLEKRDLFPFPASGRVVITATGSDRYVLHCTDLNGDDLQSLQSFFNDCKGRFKAFRFVSRDGQYQFPHCRFDSDIAHFNHDAPDRGSVVLPIKALPYKT